MPVIINARTRSTDPVQEHLRERKSVWNKACSEFIARLNAFKPALISFKRGLNGRGDQKAGLPISTIKEPLPNEISGYLGHVGGGFNELASEFATLVSEANGIVQEQAQYAEHRRKHQEQAQQMHHAADYTEADDMLIVESSNELTRTWARLLSVVQTDKAKSQRLSMLGLAAKLFKNLVGFEDMVLAKGTDNVPEIINKFYLVSNNIDTLSRDYQKLLKINNPAAVNTVPGNGATSTFQPKPSSKKPKGKALTPPTDVASSAGETPIPPVNNAPANSVPFLDLKENVVVMQKVDFFSKEDIRPFLEIFHKTRKETDPDKKDIMEDRVRELYLQLLDKVKYKVEQKIGKKLPKDITLEQLINLQKIASVSDLEMIKFSGYLSRLWNYQRHQKGSTDPSSSSRLEIYKSIRDIKIQVDKIMNLLEKKEVATDDLGNKLTKIVELIIAMSEPLGTLTMLHKDRYYEQDANKRKNQILDPAVRYFNRQIKHDVDKPGW